MKKFLNLLLAAVLSVVLVFSVACDETASDKMFEGDYKTEATAEEVAAVVTAMSTNTDKVIGKGLAIDAKVKMVQSTTTEHVGYATYKTNGNISANLSAKFNFVEAEEGVEDSKDVLTASAKLTGNYVIDSSATYVENEEDNRKDGISIKDLAVEACYEDETIFAKGKVKYGTTSIETAMQATATELGLTGGLEAMVASFDYATIAAMLGESIPEYLAMAESMGLKIYKDGTNFKVDAPKEAVEALLNEEYEEYGEDATIKNKIGDCYVIIAFTAEGALNGIRVVADIKSDVKVSVPAQTSGDYALELDSTATYSVDVTIKAWSGKVEMLKGRADFDSYTDVMGSLPL